ncbi:alpha-glucosidase (family GH31 glycosyl hydrolase) [Pedobacter africanus]|uniref:Alpha-glucosidase (Family GH31 glycosyl hydrolase) n=1 Tax=Pedobacter africanus TaxID=151894 RepID=A0ACC6KRU5_9SPHI|nr:TIM-barrel domain-containing protein [Pedobacter africanus]MDR6781852.1 alpha-glucosidase (family GH31 glycosyl hydrolase) [Pedobacter africanus]
MKPLFRPKLKCTATLLLAIPLIMAGTSSIAQQKTTAAQHTTPESQKAISAKKISPTLIEVLLSNKQKMLVDFYGDNIFRLFQDNSGGAMRDPEAKPEAKILVADPRKPVAKLNVSEDASLITITTPKVNIQIDKNTTLLKVINPLSHTVAIESIAPVKFDTKAVALTLKENPQEYFYGGGVQNGRFSHKGKAIAIENQNSWTDGGVASPTPYYWSSNGYAILWNTFKKGRYDFGTKEKGTVKLSHETAYLDVFIMINNGAKALLNDFYQLTGNPVLLPKFGFYQGHLNAYNRDFWKENEKGILFEDGKRYQESQKDNGGIKESLNGEKNNYQFSARAVIDRYKKNDMPFGWLLPNDGYGAGYGQTETLDGNIGNLKSLGDYARKNGVEIGLWTQSDLHPKAGISALLQRDIIKEVKDAGVRVLKTDVAWVGAGYSFGLNGVSDVAQIMSQYGNNSRPFIISLDGWAGTQRYAGIWSGDQTGGVWEYIRFHIPTYLGSGLSGQPNITSDMDGIFGGKNPVINTRDFQWKTFTPMQLNMDGWGSNEKYPQALGEPVTSINRTYLKLKSELMPYAYSIAKEAVTGLPMIRAMFLHYPNTYTMGTATQYQFLYGPYFLVAPIYQATKADDKGNDIRDGIYLPEGVWIDYFTGEKYKGNCILNNFDAPLWKLPVFVKAGAIIPMANPNNNVTGINKKLRTYEIYPLGKSAFTEYDDDGTTEQYRSGKGVSTFITAEVDQKSLATITIHTAKGNFNGFVKQKTTAFKINLTAKPSSISAKIGKAKVNLTEARSMAEFLRKENTYFYDAAPDLNNFATKGSEFEKVAITKNPQLLVKLGPTDITVNSVTLAVAGFKYEPADRQRNSSGKLTAPTNARVPDNNTEAYTLKPSWEKVEHADFYEIDFNGMHYTTIKDTALLFDGLAAETGYTFKLRAVNKDGHSEWTEIKATTKSNPLEFAIQGITAETTAQNQSSSEIDKLFDFDEGNLWHTKWGTKSVPFDLVIDLKAISQLDKFHYLPRTGRGNGTLQKGKVSYSNNKTDWTAAGDFEWQANDKVKVFNFSNHPSARYVKIAIDSAVGGFGSGRELYVFKVPGTESYLPGDINNDRMIDKNDLTSYTNYTGLRKGDADFEGYISNGDINKNNLIDAYDISVVATQLEGGTGNNKTDGLAGKLEISTALQNYNKGEIIEVKVKGIGLSSVNALSFALPYNQQDYEFVSLQSLNMKQMENLTYDRLHTNGARALYPTFVNLGKKETLSGDNDLFILKLKAKRNLKSELKITDGILVDSRLNAVKF